MQSATARTMSPQRSNPENAAGPEKCNIAEVQDKDFKNSYYEYIQGL